MNKYSLGTWITIGHFSIAELLSDAGFDWLCVDIEHSVIDYYELAQMISAIQGRGCKAFVRVGENNRRIIKRVLDAGADGLIIPSVNSKTEAENAIKYAKYPPEGERGVGLSRAQKYGFGFETYRDGKAKEITLIAQIEHINAINELEEILSLQGIDGTFIGPYDLSGSMGKPGQYDDEDVKEALTQYELIAKKFNKLIGFHVIQPDHRLVEEKVEKGYNFIAFSLDTLFLGTLAKQQLELIRSKNSN
jgi:2-dehydro-3-deoxyglucarate aldolase